MEESKTKTMEEILHQDDIEDIVTHVPIKDLCNLSRASSYFRFLTNKPKLWKEMKVSKVMLQGHALSRLFSIDKFKHVRKIDMSGLNLTPMRLVGNLESITTSKVEELNLYGVSLAEVPAELLRDLSLQLKKLDLGRTRPSQNQLEAVLDGLVHSTTMTDLGLEGSWSLSSVPPQLLGEAVRGLQKLDLGHCLLLDAQKTSILGAVISSTTLLDMSLHNVPLLSVSPHLLSQAVKNIGSVNLSSCRLTKLQSSAVFVGCAASDKLNNVQVGWNDSIGDVSRVVLSRAIANLASVSLRGGPLREAQIMAVVEEAIASPKLLNLELCENDLKNVTPIKMVELAHKLEVLILDNTHMRPAQILAVLQASVTSQKLTRLSMDGAKLADIPPQVLSDAVGHLEYLGLRRVKLSMDQKTLILQALVGARCTLAMDSAFSTWKKVGDNSKVLDEAKATGRLQLH